MTSTTRPLVDKVCPNLKKRIQSNAFVDFHELLNDNNLPKEKPGKGKDFYGARQRKNYLTELEWCTAFDIYMAAYIDLFPEQTQGLLTYGNRIKIFMKQGNKWSDYDEKFRKEIEIDVSRGLRPDWTELKMDLYLLTAQRSSPTTQYQSFRNKPFEKQVPLGFCFAYHSGESQCSPSCSFRHSCPSCGRNHPLHAHGKRSEDLSRPSGTRNRNNGQMANPSRRQDDTRRICTEKASRQAR